MASAESLPAARSARNTVTVILVWSCWGLMTAAALWVVGAYGSNMPWLDEFANVPYLTGQLPRTPATLWRFHNEHRIFLARVCYLAVFALTHDVKAVMYFDVALLSGLAAAGLRTARQVRGRTRLADAFVPLMCLSWAHVPNLLWAFQVCFFLAVVLAGFALLAMLRDAQDPTVRTALVGGVSVALLPLTCGVGLLLAPPLTVWLFGAALRAWRFRPRRVGTALVNVLCGLTAWGLVALYLRGMGRSARAGEVLGFGSLRSVLAGGGRFLAGGFGFGAVAAWPYSGATAGLVFLLVPLLAGYWAWRRRTERLRTAAVLLSLAAWTGFALVLLAARGPQQTPYNRFVDRYMSLALPGYLAVFLALVIFDGRVLSRVGQTTLCALALAALPWNLHVGRRHAEILRFRFVLFREQLEAGASSGLLAHRFSGGAVGICSDERAFEELLRQMKRARLCHLEHMKLGYEGPGIREVPLSADVVRRRRTTWTLLPSAASGVGGSGQVTGGDPSLVFRLSGPRYVHALRFKTAYRDFAGGDSGTRLRVFWKNGAETFTSEARNATVDVPEGDSELIVWLDALVDEIRIDPAEAPCSFVFTEMTLVVGEGEQGKAGVGEGDETHLKRVPFAAAEVRATQTTWTPGRLPPDEYGVNGAGRVSGEAPSLVFRLPRKQGVHALRFRVTYADLANGAATTCLRVFWKNDTEAFTERGRCESINVAAGTTEVVVPVDGVVDTFRLDPSDLPCWFWLSDMSLVVSEFAVPERVAALGTSRAVCDGVEALVLVGGTAFYDVPPGRRRVSGLHGVWSAAYDPALRPGPDRTDGVEFAVEFVSPLGIRSVLYRKRLDPFNNPADRGPIPFAVELPAGQDGGTLEVRTFDEPPHNPGYDWGYWARIKFD
jgi:hypothetical protein